MDTKDERDALAVTLLLEAGRIMEDTSPEFALAIRDGDEISDRVERLEQTAEDLAALAGAARALLRQRS
jgi:hypothetical protein